MSTLAAAAERLAAGDPVLVGDQRDQAIFVAAAADTVAPDQLARLQELGRGIVVLALGGPIAERLRLPAPDRAADRLSALQLMTPIDAATGISGGWSLRDRARTMRVAASPDSGPLDLTIPGHVLPARVREHGADAAAAAVELARISDHAPAVALCAVLARDGALARIDEARSDPALARLAPASSAELHSHMLGRIAEQHGVSCELPTREGSFRAIGFEVGDREPATIALVHGDPRAAASPLVHVHVACRLGDAFGSLICDCRAQLDAAIAAIIAEGCGVIIYAQPSASSPALCARAEPIDVSVAAGLLRAAGVTRLRPSERALQVAPELRDRGLEVQA